MWSKICDLNHTELGKSTSTEANSTEETLNGKRVAAAAAVGGGGGKERKLQGKPKFKDIVNNHNLCVVRYH